MPETMEIKLVDASALADYEIWFLLTSVCSSAVIGFLVATEQATKDQLNQMIAITVVFAIIALICMITAIFKRNHLRRKTKSVKFKLGEILDES